MSLRKKGLGYEPAVKNPVWFHACPPFVRETGAPAKKAARPSYTQIAIESLIQAGPRGQADRRDHGGDVRRDRPEYFRKRISGPDL